MSTDKDKSTASQKKVRDKNVEKNEAEPDLSKVTSLSSYYELEKFSASRFLSILKKNSVGRLSESDLQKCLEQLEDKDPNFAKTVDLMYQGTRSPSLHARQCVVFATDACRLILNNASDRSIDFKGDATAVYRETLRLFVPKMESKKEGVKSLNVLKAVGMWCSYSRNVDIATLVNLFVKQVDGSARRKGKGRASAFDVLFRPSTKFKGLTDILMVAKSCSDRADIERIARDAETKKRIDATVRANKKAESLKAAKSEMARLEDRITELERAVNNSNKEAERLQQQLDERMAVHKHGKSEQRGRSRVFLKSKLAPLLETAYEFAELDPPRRNIILERLEIALSEIAKEVEWLEESTD